MEYFFSKNSGLYFFSSLLQADAAIFAIVGIFVIYKLQSVQSKIDSIRNYLLGQIGKTTDELEVQKFDELTTEQKMNFEPSTDKLGLLYNKWARLENANDFVKLVVRTPTLFIFIGLTFNSFGLTFASFIHNAGYCVEIIVIGLNLILHLYIFLSIGRRTIKIIESHKDYVVIDSQFIIDSKSKWLYNWLFKD